MGSRYRHTIKTFIRNNSPSGEVTLDDLTVSLRRGPHSFLAVSLSSALSSVPGEYTNISAPNNLL